MSLKPESPNRQSNARGGFSQQYAMNYQEVVNLMGEVVGTNFTNIMSKFMASPNEALISLTCYPFYVTDILPEWEQTGWSYIKIGNYNCTQSHGKLMNYRTPPLLEIADFTIQKHFNSFLDYAPYTKLELYLPYIDVVTLDNDVVMGKRIKVKYAVDFNTGRCTAFITSVINNVETLIMTRDGQIGINCALSGGNGQEIAQNIAKIGISVATTIAGAAIAGGAGAGAGAAAGTAATSSASTAAGAGAVIGGVSSTLNAITGLKSHINKMSGQSGDNNTYAPQNAYLIITRPKVVAPANYASTKGKPSRYYGQLGAITGYTEVAGVHIEGEYFGKITEDERTEIDRLLKEGVIL